MLKETFAGNRVRAFQDADYVEVVLSRAEARNALDRAMRDELVEVLEPLADSAGSVTIGLLGEGPDFCAGGDIDEFGSSPDVVTAWHVRLVRSLPTLFSRLGDCMVVGIQGAAVGAGVELAAFAARVVATPSARFRLPELSMGLVPGSGGTVSLPRRIPVHRAIEMMLFGDWLDTVTARSWGLVDRIVNEPQLIPTVRQEASQLLR
jgi:enoyl-CoA hydratase/carnithine racemase